MNFFDTSAGYDFANFTVPQLVEAIKTLNETVKTLSDKVDVLSAQLDVQTENKEKNAKGEFDYLFDEEIDR